MKPCHFHSHLKVSQHRAAVSYKKFTAAQNSSEKKKVFFYTKGNNIAQKNFHTTYTVVSPAPYAFYTGLSVFQYFFEIICFKSDKESQSYTTQARWDLEFELPM